MGVRFLIGTYDGTQNGVTVMIDSVSGFAFGPYFEPHEEVDEFIDWLKITHSVDPRELTDSVLEGHVSEWRRLHSGDDGEA
jgi:hypothetical protein